MNNNIPDMSIYTINELADIAHETMVEHGFYRDIDRLIMSLRYGGEFELSDIAERDFVLGEIAKIASECGEAVQAVRKGEPLEEELADIIIRTMTLAVYLELDIGRAVVNKMQDNRGREYLHGKLC